MTRWEYVKYVADKWAKAGYHDIANEIYISYFEELSKA